MKAVYPSEKFMPDGDSVMIWYGLLKDLEYERLNIAIQKWICTEKFPPTIADLRRLCTEQAEKLVDWSEAWEDVRRAVHYYGYYRKDEGLASLEGITRTAAERFGWSELCDMSLGDIQVHRAQFRDIYNSVQVQHKETAALPEKLKTALLGIEERNLING